MNQDLEKWREQWNSGDIKFVPELFEMVENLQKQNYKLNQEIGKASGRMMIVSDQLKDISRELFNA